MYTNIKYKNLEEEKKRNKEDKKQNRIIKE
jgi:hypothetical protein